MDSPRFENNFPHDLKLDSRRKNAFNSFFGAYMAIYEQFKKWHFEIIENSNIVGPETR